MTTTIFISGQISGNFTLAGALNGYEMKESAMFNGFKLTYRTKKEAVQDIRQAYRRLRSDEPETATIRCNEKRTELYYDASKAIIYTK